MSPHIFLTSHLPQIPGSQVPERPIREEVPGTNLSILPQILDTSIVVYLGIPRIGRDNREMFLKR